jgi:hypothetical protein
MGLSTTMALYMVYITELPETLKDPVVRKIIIRIL